MTIDPYGWTRRIKSYITLTGFPESLFIAADGRLVGTWIMGNDYRVKSQFYGGYPNTYLRRVKGLFPETNKTLHLFAGKVDLSAFPGDTVDINPALKPTFVDDGQTLTRVPIDRYTLFLVDPPYSVEDAEHYQTTMISRNKVMDRLSDCQTGAHVVWLDQVLPMYRKVDFHMIGIVGIVRSTNHRFRVMTIFRRK